ncbi:MAG: alpha/beta fold hydrolase [Janthinobacterium lividum]
MTDKKIEKPVFVLIHGGWHGGWCYAETARLLRQQGYDVYAPSLTGLGDRSHLVSRTIDLSTHIDDIVNLIKWEDLRNVVLCGHSYGGLVISGVADRARDRVSLLTYLDALLPQSGQSMHDVLPLDRAERFRSWAAERGFGWLVPPTPASIFVNRKEAIAWVDSLCVPHPLRCFEEPVRFSTDAIESLARQYIVATDFPKSSFPAVAAALRGKPGWRVDELHVNHDAMVDDPAGVARLLVEGYRTRQTQS